MHTYGADMPFFFNFSLYHRHKAASSSLQVSGNLLSEAIHAKRPRHWIA
jgi:hypothetical protein